MRILVAGLCLTAAVAIWALIAGSFDGTSGRVLLTGLTAAVCTLGGLAGSTALRFERGGKRFGQATIGLSQLTLVLALALIWIPGASDGDTLWRAFGIAGVLTLAGAHASLLASRSSKLDTRAVRRLSQGAIACSTAIALLISVMLAVDYDSSATGIWRAIGVLTVFSVLNTLLVPLARRITRDTRRRTGSGTKPSLWQCV